MAVKRAKRQQLRLAMNLMGPSGAGKTVGALLLAYGMMKKKYPELNDFDLWGKIGLIDTEHERSLIYEGMDKGGVTIGQFWHKDMRPPYSADAYTAAAHELRAEGAEVIVVDSLSHGWTGEGGVLDRHESGSMANWNTTNKQFYNPLVNFAIGETCGLHMINTVRSKQTYAMEPDENGKTQVKKIGLQPVQRDQLEYEFQIALAADMENKVKVLKDNSGIFEGYDGMITPEHGAQIYDWLEAGIDIFAERREAAAKADAERLTVVKYLRELEKEHDYLPEVIQSLEKHPSIQKPLEQFDMEWLKKTEGLMLQKIKTADTAKGDKK